MRELIDAVKSGQTDSVRKILDDLKRKNPANVKKVIDELDYYDNASYTAVCWAAEKGFLSIIELLIEAGVNLQHVSAYKGMNVHQIAKFYGHSEIAKKIADNLLLQTVVGNCDEAMIDSLMNEGVNPLISIPGKENSTAIDMVAAANITAEKKSTLIYELANAVSKKATDDQDKKKLLALMDRYKHHILPGNLNNMGTICNSLKDYVSAVYWFQRSAASTEAENQWGKRNLAMMYIGPYATIKRNLPEAISLLMTAHDDSIRKNLAYSASSSLEQIKIIADMQNLIAAEEVAARDNARRFLVKIYLEKNPPDLVEAEKYFNLVHEKEEFQPYADYFAALKLLKGDTAKREEPDVVSAIERLKKLAIDKLNIAKLKLQELANQDKDIIAKNLAKIALYEVTKDEKYVLKDKPWLDYFNGICALNGWRGYPTPDLIEAANLFESAAQQGIMLANIRLAECFELYPSGVLQSSMRAVGEAAVKSMSSDAVYVLKRTQKYLSVPVADLKVDAKDNAPKPVIEPVNRERVVWLEKAIDLQKRSNNDNDKLSLAANLYELGNLLRKSDYVRAFGCFKQAAELKHAPAMIEVANAYYLGWYNNSGTPAIHEAIDAHKQLIDHYANIADWVNVDIWHNKLLKINVLADVPDKKFIDEISLDIRRKKIAFNKKAVNESINAGNADGISAFENSLLTHRASVPVEDQKAIDGFVAEANIQKIGIYKNKIDALLKAKQLDQANIEINKLRQLKLKVDAQHQNEIENILIKFNPYISKLLQKKFINLPTAEICKYLSGQRVPKKMAAEAVLLDRAKKPDPGAAAALIQFYEEQAHQKEEERNKLLGKVGEEANVSAENRVSANRCQLDAIRFFHLAAELGSIYAAERISDYAEPFDDNWDDTQQLTLARRTLTEGSSVQYAKQLKEQARQKDIARLSIGFEAKFEDLCRKALRKGSISDIESIALALVDEKQADSIPFLKKIPHPEIKATIMRKAARTVADVCAAKKNIFDRSSSEQHTPYMALVSWAQWNCGDPDLFVANYYYRTLAMAEDSESISRYAMLLYANSSLINSAGVEFYWSFKACILGDESQRHNLELSDSPHAKFYLSLLSLERRRAFKAEGISDPDVMLLLELNKCKEKLGETYAVITRALQTEMREYAAKQKMILDRNSTAVVSSAVATESSASALYPSLSGAALDSVNDAKAAAPASSQAQVYQLLPGVREGAQASLAAANQALVASAPALEVAELSEGVVRDVVSMPLPDARNDAQAVVNKAVELPRKLAFA